MGGEEEEGSETHKRRKEKKETKTEKKTEPKKKKAGKEKEGKKDKMLPKVTKKIKVNGETKRVLKVHRNQKVNDALAGFKGRAQIANLNAMQTKVDMKTKQKNMDAAKLKAKKLTDLSFEQRHARTMAVEISLKKADEEKMTKMMQQMRQKEQREMDKKTAEMHKFTRKEIIGKKSDRIKEVSNKAQAKHAADKLRSKELQQKRIEKARMDIAIKEKVSRSRSRRRSKRRLKKGFSGRRMRGRRMRRRMRKRMRRRDDKKIKKEKEKERR